MKRTVVCDIEADALLPHVSKIWCVVCKDYDTGEVFSWTPDTLHEFPEWAANEVSHWIGHNFIGYDMRVLKKILNMKIKGKHVTDTLLVSRLQMFSRPGGHSLDNWGKILNHPKLPFKDFSEYTEEMLTYCINDVELTYQVACYLKSEGKKYGSNLAEKIEHAVQIKLEDQSEAGFALDVVKAHKLFAMFHNEANRLEREIKEEIKPKPVLIDERVPKYKQDGTISKVGLSMYDDYTIVGGPFSYIKFQEFDLNSPKQKVERLNPWWSPTIRTKGYRNLLDQLKGRHPKLKVTQEEFDDKQQYMWQVCEENLRTISDDAPQTLRKLGEHAMYVARYNEVKGWLDALGDDDRVHGSVFSIGAITHRMSHNSPNLANIPGSDSPFGEDCRSCFTVSDPVNYRLLGCDADGIQLRVLANYMNDPDYTHEVVHGDIHTKNLEAMGIDKGVWLDDKQQWSGRSVAKTFIYAWLLGAGDEKVGLICGGDSSFGRRVKQQFLESLPSLAALKDTAAKTAKLGRLRGLDGRMIEVKSAHYALGCYLQGAESCIMKWAMLQWQREVKERKLDARQVAIVHDEFQVEVHKDHADEVGQIIVDNIINAGVYFNMNCPLDASYKVGLNWKDTH